MRRIQTIITSPSATPVTLAEAKAHLRVTFSEDDTLITTLINVATQKAEQILQRKLITQTWKMFLNRFPVGDELVILFGDLQSVTHIKYTDSDESQSTFSSDDYLVDTDSVPGRVVLKDGESWPTDSLSPKNPIEIQFVTGYLSGEAVGAAVIDGNGLDDLTSGGTFSGTTPTNYTVEIDGTGTPDTFKWSKNDGADAGTTVNITGAAQTLDNGVTVTFDATTGHTSGDKWNFTAGSSVPQDIRHGIFMIISHLYENREPFAIGTIVSEIPGTTKSLLYNHRVWDWIL